MNLAPDREMPVQTSVECMRRELWRVESQFRAWDIGPDESLPTPRFTTAAPAVNLIGMAESEKGVGEALRTTLRSLDAVGATRALHNFKDSGSENVDRSHAEFSEHFPHSINLLHIGPDLFGEFLRETPREFLRRRCNIGCWAWETSEFPPKWEGHFAHLDEIWVPSSFTQDAVSRVAPIPVVRIPHSIPQWLATEKVSREEFAITPGTFVFLFVFDFASSVARKNPMGVIKAFKTAFGDSRHVMLVLKSTHAAADPAAMKSLVNAAAGLNVRIIDGVFPRKKINGLLNLCDCYVSLHRAEGFGLTMAEAMCLGKPVIATDYSGNTDYMNASNSFPVRYEPATIAENQRQYEAGTVWAEPDLVHAAELMRYVVQEPDEAARIGRQARWDIARYLNPVVVGGMMCDRLRRCMNRGT